MPRFTYIAKSDLALETAETHNVARDKMIHLFHVQTFDRKEKRPIPSPHLLHLPQPSTARYANDEKRALSVIHTQSSGSQFLATTKLADQIQGDVISFESRICFVNNETSDST